MHERTINGAGRKPNGAFRLDSFQFLFREMDFPKGCFLMTGTGIVPPDDFSLKVNDRIEISIEGIGSLINEVAQ